MPPSPRRARSACSSPISAEERGTLVLASASPQRRAILERLGVAFEVRVSGVEELAEGPPHEVALENAYRKASAVAAQVDPGRPVLGVDTLVALGRRIYGKPAGRAQARATLEDLAGRRHAVIGGVCLIEGERVRTVAATTTVEFRPLTGEQIERYLDTQEWRERAGAYAIQERGALIVRAIEGDYLNVVGLPVAAICELSSELLDASLRP